MDIQNLKSKVFRKYIFFNTIMLCLPICIFCIIIYNSIINEFRQKNITSCNYEARQIANQLDNKFIQYRRIRDTLLNTSWVIRYMSNTDIFDNEFDVIKKNSISRELMNYKSLNFGIDNIAVYFPKKDTVFNQIGWFSSDDFFSNLNLLDASSEQLQSLVENAGNFKYVDISIISGETTDTVLIIQRLELATIPRAMLLLFISKKNLEKYIDSISSSLLAGYSISWSNGSLIERPYTRDKNSDDICQLSVHSDSHIFKYDFTYRIDTVSPNLKSYSFIFIATAISLVAGSLIAFLLASVSYMPIKNIVRKIFNGSKAPDKINEYEYKLINSTFDNLFVEKRKMQLQVIKYQNAARNDMLKRLLAGYFEQDIINFKMSEIGLDYTDDVFYFVILLGDDRYQKETDYKNSDMFVLYNTVDKIMSNMGLSYQIVESMDDNIIIILDFAKEEPDQNFREHLYEAFSVAKKALPLHTEIFFGSAERGIIGISKSYQTAKEELNKSIIKSNILRMNLLITKGLLYYYPTDWEIQLINKLKLGDYGTVKRILDEIKLENEKRSYNEASIIKLTSGIIETMTRVLNELNMDINDLEEQKQELLLLQRTENIQWLWDYTYLVSSKICDRTDNVNTHDNLSIPKQIVEYINCNITDSNLSLKELGDKFNLSISSISKHFKDNMGINFYDYICRVRMEKAKEMLSANKVNIQHIAKSIGYENDYSFKRAFFRYEGVKPEEYKKIVAFHKLIEN